MTYPALLVFGFAHFAPDLLSRLSGGTVRAWEVVAYGAEAAALWLMLGAMAAQHVRHPLALQAVALAGAFESLQRPVCRLAFPMDRAPPLQEGQTLCDAALGVSSMWLSVVAALMAAFVVQEVQRDRSNRGG